MTNLKKKKYMGLLGILLLIMGIIFLFSYGKIDKYKGLVKVKNAKLLSSVANTETMTSKGTEEVSYKLTYKLDEVEGLEKRNLIIKGILNSEYAEFIEINGNNIESTVSNEGKKIEVRINNVRLGEEQELEIPIQIKNAPNKEEIRPVIRIKEATGEETRVTGSPIKVETRSILGVVYDENRLPVGNIELSINKNGREIKRTYTREDGVFNFSDLDDGEYILKVEEDNYEIESGSNTRISDDLQEIKVKTVDKFDIETHKYVERLKLVIDGKEKTYTYKDKEKVVEALKNVKEVSGEIEYKIVVKNRGEKDTAIERVIDERGEGLKFNQEKNSGWEEEDEKIYYRPLEGVSLSSGETREVRLILDIEKTKEIKTYINKLTTKGEIKEKVIYILDGRKIKEESVIEGDKVSRPSIEVEGWYTDKNYTNKYNFNREVNKDLILYAKTRALEYTVRYIDEGNVIKEEIVREGEKATGEESPNKVGYTFKCWTLNNNCYDFNKKVTSNIDLISEYQLNVYNITYKLNGGKLKNGKTNPSTYTINTTTFTLNNPLDKVDDDGDVTEVFVGWIGSNGSTPSMEVTLPELDKLEDKEYEAVYEEVVPGRYTITYKLNGGLLEEGKTNPTSYEKSDLPIKLNNPSKTGYSFIGWTGSNGETPENVTVPKGTKSNLSYEANYEPINYTIAYDLDGGSLEEGKINRESYNIETEEFTLNNPYKTGYEFLGWTGSNGEEPSKIVTLPDNKLENKNYKANYKVKKYIVTYMDGNDKYYEEEVEYNKKALGTNTTPSKAHNIFIKWVKEDQSAYDFNTPVTEDITLYSSYEEVEKPSISHTPTEWTRNNVLVNITSEHADYEYMYKVGLGDYQKYTGPFEVEENCTVYAYSVKNEVSSIEVTHDITNIDKINPLINKATASPSATSVLLHIKGQDLESGIKYIKVYNGEEILFSTEEYPGNNNDEQTETVTIENLTELFTYTFIIEVEDKVGNVTREEVSFETPDKHYVARTYENDGTEIKKYETLREAIESRECISKCNIQMLDNVTETNVVLEGQTIKLDLNGLIITGLEDKAFENNGEFQIVDYNEEEIGKVYSDGIGIINNGKLYVGENEQELVVSKTEPIIEGAVTGINSPGELHFYDGKIIGGSTTGALKGTAPITPYSYNASVETSEEKEIATLEVIADAEARINSVYYTKVQEAVDSSKNGKYVTPEGTAEIMSQVESKSDYRFIYDEETGTLKTNNQGVGNSYAESYIYFDLRNETDDKVLNLVTSISSQSGVDMGYATVTDNKEPVLFNQENGRIIYVSGETSDQVNYILEKGKEYYLHFGYRKDGGTNSGDDTFTINSIELSDYSKNNENGELLKNLISKDDKHFIKQEDNSYQNNYIGVKNRIVDSYVKFDMTGIDEEKVLYAEISGRTPTSWGSESYDYITITNSEDTPSYDQTEGRVFYANGDISRRNVEIHLLPNQENYIHFCQYNGNYIYDSNTVFNLHSLKLEDEILKERLSSDMTPNGTYYMYESTTEEKKWKDLSGNGNTGIIVGATLNDTEDGYIFDGSSYVYIPNNQISIDEEESVEVKFSTTSTAARSVLYTGNDTEKITIAVYDGYLIVTTKNTYNTFNLPENYNNGEVNSFIVTYNNGEYKAYFNNTELEKRTNTDWWDTNSNTYIGCRRDGNYFDGTIYQVKVFDRVLTDEEISNNNIGDENLQLYLDASDSKIVRDNPIFINNNQGVPNSVASSYMTFDLTNVTSYKTIYVNCEISSYNNTWPGNGDWGFVTVTGSETTPAYNDTSGRYVAIMGEVEAKEYPVTLTPGRVNYVHFGYRKDGHGHSGRDTFQINYIRYYEDSNNTISKYIFSNSTTKKTYTPEVTLNEEPDVIQLIRNVTVTKPLEITETRNAILDLNGFTLTTSKEDYVINNKGSLKIIDGKYNEQINTEKAKYDVLQEEFDTEYETKLAEQQEYLNTVQETFDSKYESDMQNAINNHTEPEYTYFIKDGYTNEDNKIAFDAYWSQTVRYEEGSGVYFYCNSGSNYTGYIFSNEKIDITDYDKMVVKYKFTTMNGRVDLFLSEGKSRGNLGQINNYVSTTPVLGNEETFEVDLSSATGEWYLAFDTPTTQNQGYVTDFYLVKGDEGIAKMSSNNEPLLYTSSVNASSVEKNHDAYKLFDKSINETDSFQTDLVEGDINHKSYSEVLLTGKIEYTMTDFDVYYGSNPQTYPSSIKLYGSNDNENYKLISDNNIDSSSIISETAYKYTIDSYDSYKYYKWVFESDNESILIEEIIPTIYNVKRDKTTDTSKMISYDNNIYTIDDYVSDGLLLHYDSKSHGNEEGIWKDLSENNNDGTLVNATYDDSKKAFIFNGSNAYIYKSNENISIDENETVEVMFSTNTTGNQVFYNGSNTQKIGIGTWDGYIIVANQSANSYTYDIPSNLADGKIHTISVVYKDSEYKAYFDNKLMTRRTNTNNWGSNTNVYVGVRSNGNYFNGYIYNVKVYNKALTQDEIVKNYNVNATRYNLGEIKRREPTLETPTGTGNIISTTYSAVLNDYDAYLDVDSIINLNKSGNLDVITNRGNLKLSENAIVSGMQTSNRGINNTTRGDLLESTGYINMAGSSNIGILNQSMVDDNIKGFNINVTNSNSYNYYNNSEIEHTLDNITTSGSGVDIYQNVDHNLLIKDSTLGSAANESFYSNESNEESTITFNNCDIKNRIYNRQNSYRKIIINDSTMSGSRENIFNFHGKVEVNNSELDNSSHNIQQAYGLTTINNSTLKSNYRNIYGEYIGNSGGSIIIDNSTLTAGEFNIYSYRSNIEVNDSTLNAYGTSIYNGYISGNNVYSGSVNLKNTDINKIGTGDANVVYNYVGNLTMDGGSITNVSDNSNAFYNESNGTILIKGNFYTNEKFNRGIYNNNGSVTIGINDEEVSKKYPLFQSSNTTIYKGNSGKFYYYDGKLVGIKDNAIDGSIDDLPELYDINVTKGDELETIVLDTEVDRHDNNDYVASIGDSKFVSLQEAVDSITTSDETEIKLLKEIETYSKVNIPSNKNIILNYDKHNIKVYNLEHYFENDGTLKFKDTDSNAINNKSFAKSFIINNGTLNYEDIKSYSIRNGLIITNNENGVLNIESGEIYSYESGLIDNSGKMNVSGGKIYATRTDYNNSGGANLIENRETGELTFTGGEIRFVGSGIVINNKNKLKISDIKVELYGHYHYRFVTVFNTFIYNDVGAEAIVTGGSFGAGATTSNEINRGTFIKNYGVANISDIESEFVAGVFNYSGATITLDNVKMNHISGGHAYAEGTEYIYNAGTMTVTGGSYSGNPTYEFFYNTGSGNLIIRDASISSYNSNGCIHSLGNSTITIDNTSMYQTAASYNTAGAVLIEDSSSAIISNSEITANAPRYNDYTSSSGIVHYSTNEVTLDNVDVSSNSDAIFMRNSGTLNIKSGSYVSSSLRSIYNISTGIINVGQKGGVPSKLDPEITGNSYGLYNSNEGATINFYDGVITGTTSIYGVINEIEPGYDIILETESGKEVKYLDKLPVYKNIDKSENNTYDSLQDAFDDASNGDTIQLLRELTTLNSLETAVNSKTVTFDLNGKKIIQNNETFISNEGNLTIKDSTSTLDENGIYQGEGLIESNGLTIINNSGTLNVNSGNLYSKNTKIISNSGRLEINNGNIYMNIGTGGATSNLISNSETGIVNINGGYLKTTSQSSEAGSIVNNEGAVTINDGRFDILGHSGGRAYIVYNATENSNANILGGIYISKNNYNDYNSIMYNNGTGLIQNINFDYSYIVSNSTTGNIIMKNIVSNHSSTHLADNSIYSKGTIEIDNLVINDTIETNPGYLINISEGTATINNSTINVGTRVLYLGGSSTTTLEGCEITSKYDRALLMEGASNLNIKESDISTTYSNSNVGGYNSLINNESSGLLNIESGNIKAENVASAIYSTGGGKNITIGKKDGTVTDTPVIKGMLYPIYQSTEDSSVLINLKMYDGKLIAQNYLYGNIVETEDDNYILTNEEDSLKVMYVGKKYAVENLTSGTKHYTIKDAIDHASSNDKLKVLRNIVLTQEDDTINIPESFVLTIDLNNHSIKFNVKDCIVNDGELEIKDSSENKNGIIESYNSKLLTNNGIFTLTNSTIRSYKVYTEAITNTGTINNNGSIIVYRSDTQRDAGKDTSIMNDGIINSSGILKNSSGLCGYLEWYGTGPSYLIRNRVGGTVNITGGEVTYYAQGSPIYNLGTLNITGGDFSNSSCNGGTSSIIRNGGTSTITGGTFGTSENKMKKTIFNNEGTQTVSNLTIYAGIYSINNTGSLTLNDDTMYFEDYAINSSGSSLIVNNGTYTSSGPRPIITSSSDTHIEGVTLKNEANTGLLLELSNETIVNNSDLLSKGPAISANGGSDVTITNSSVRSTESNGIYINGGTVNVKDLSPYMIKSDTANGIYMDSGTLNLGLSGGVPNLSEPTVYGKTYGVYKNNNAANFYFYDGVIKGETGSIYGTITDTEIGYKEKRDNITDSDTGVTTTESTLTVVGETERVAVVNNINFLSLQSAVNYASNNGIENIQMYKSITLEDNIVLPTGGSNVKIYLGSYTIDKGDYSLGTGIEEVSGTAPGASLSRFLANITGTEINPKNIVIFEMSDGSKLDSTVTYKLYKLTDNGYKIVKVNENLIGDYDLGSEKEEMNVTRGKLYIYGIGEGTYKLVGTDTKEITFEINAHNVSNNIRINNAVKANRSVSVIATVILQLQTGVARNPYILMIMVLIIVILGFIAYKKYKEGLE